MTTGTPREGFGRISRRRLILGSTGGVLLAANAGLLAWQGGLFKRKKRPETLELSFKGPFSYDQRVMESPIANSWIELKDVDLFDQNSRRLGVRYELKGDKDPRKKFKIVVSVTTADGKTHTLVDGARCDARCLPIAWVGSAKRRFSPVSNETLALPAKLSEIVKLHLRFEIIEPTTSSAMEDEVLCWTVSRNKP